MEDGRRIGLEAAECGEDFPVQVLINGVEENDKAIGDNAFFTTVEENKEMCKLDSGRFIRMKSSSPEAMRLSKNSGSRAGSM